ncbi:MAG: DUF1697 domain-containing protein [Longimicrobiales bacterium]
MTQRPPARHAAFMRGLNLGNRRLTNDELEAAVRGAGFEGVAAYQASGNVVYDAGAGADPGGEEARLEERLEGALGYPVDTFVRTLDEVAAVASAEPFGPAEAGVKVHVMMFKEPPGPDASAALDGLSNADDRFAVRGREVYWFRRGGLTEATVDVKDIHRATGRRTNTMRTLTTLARIVKKFAVVALFLGVSACAGDEAPDASETAGAAVASATAEPQTMSLFGDPLYAMEDTTGAIAEADSILALEPDKVDYLINAGRVRRNFWQYREAIDLYTQAIELAADDWRPYRFRGHRWISLRDFDRGIADLETARALAPMNWDVAYHLGLGYYLAGRFADAADEYTRCLDLADDPEAQAADTEDFRSCARNATDPESTVAMTEWAVRAALRAGRDDQVQALLATVPSDWEISENIAYYHDLLFYKGERTAEELLNVGEDGPYRRETVGYGVANWWLAQGDTAAAQELLEELVLDPWWPGFGRIAAEVELYRLVNP